MIESPTRNEQHSHVAPDAVDDSDAVEEALVGKLGGEVLGEVSARGASSVPARNDEKAGEEDVRSLGIEIRVECGEGRWRGEDEADDGEIGVDRGGISRRDGREADEYATGWSVYQR